MGKVYAICNQKGGTGKTTTAVSLAQAAAHKGLRVLAIDLDPQGHLTLSVGGKSNKGNAYELINGEPIVYQEQEVQGMTLISSTPNLAALTTFQGSARRLQTALGPVGKRYDVVIIDTPTQPGELLFNALQAADGVVVATKSDTLSLQGFYQLISTMRGFRESNPTMERSGIVVTAYDGRSKYAQHMLATITEKGQGLGFPLLGVVRPAVALQEAQGWQESLYTYAPKSKPAADYLAILDKLI